jgi:archaellum component FlaC
MSDVDIVSWLRSILHNDRSVELRCQEAANEIERLRKERDEAMALIEKIANEVNVLSTRPAAIIKFSDLVDQINEWGDAARKILGSKENTDD